MGTLSSTPSSILVLIDNFLIGGRETYIASSLQSLNKLNAEKSSHALLTSKFDIEQTNGLFDEVASVDEATDISAWLKEGDCLVANIKPKLIWAHHYGLLPAFLLAVRHNLPLVITLHGAPFSYGKLRETDILGLLLCLQFGGTVTVVSEEIKDELTAAGVSNSNILVTPNCVSIEKKQFDQQRALSKLNCLLMTRPQKLDHIRAAVLLAAALDRKVNTELTIHTGRESADTRYINQSLSQLLGRKWILKRPSIWFFLKKIRIKPPVKNSIDVIAQANVVFGMGRVLLEGIAANRLSVLIGYRHVKGILNQQVYDEFKYSNFSGRGIKSKPLNLIVNEIINVVNEPEKSLLTEKQRNEISVKTLSVKFFEIFKNAKSLAPVQINTESNTEIRNSLLNQLNTENTNVYKQLCFLLVKQEHK